MYNTIIIGAGAAGLFTGANLTEGDTLILESGNKAGRKILISGGGMCNLTNRDSTEDFITRFGSRDKENFLKPALLNLDTEKTYTWFEDNGLELITREDGKVFPASLKAQSVIETLLRKIAENNIKVKYNSEVTKVEYSDSVFKVYTNSEVFKSENLVITTGGKSYKDTGANGSGYNFAKDLGHNIINPSPALTSVKVKDYSFKNLTGNSVKQSSCDFYRFGENKRYLNSHGDLLFTHTGISGPVILNNSREIQSGDIIKASLVTCSNKEKMREDLVNHFNKSKNFKLKKCLKELKLSTSLVNTLIGELEILDDKIVNSIGKKSIKRIINLLLEYPFTVGSKTGFNGAMVTAGGVDIKEINRKTMESKLIPGLYFAGEVIDIDGDTGGYNIQAAFSTAKLVVQSIKKSDLNKS